MSASVQKKEEKTSHDNGMGPKQWITWVVGGIIGVTIITLVIFLWLKPMLEHTAGGQASNPAAAAQVVQTAPAQPEPVVCEPSSTEVRHCTFGTAGTAGFGTVADGHVCLDQFYGPNQTYRFQYWDTDHAQWQDFDAQHDPATFSTVRFIANPGINSVTVGYWKSETACAANDAPQSESSDATLDEPVEIIHVVP